MPENFKSLMEGIPPGGWASLIMAAGLAALRIVGDKESSKWKRAAFEVPTCAALGLTVGLAAQEFGIGTWGSILAASLVGHFGTVYIKDLVSAFISRKVK